LSWCSKITQSNIDLTHILFGNVLGISDSGTSQQTVLRSARWWLVVLMVVFFFFFPPRPDPVCFDPTPRPARSAFQYRRALFTLLLSGTVLSRRRGLQTVGIILVVAMLVTPGATAHLCYRSF